MLLSSDALARRSDHEETRRTGFVSQVSALPRLHSVHDPSVAGRGGLHLRGSPRDRARAHPHLLRGHVLPLRVPRDLDRVVRPQRERRLCLSLACPSRPDAGRRAARRAIARSCPLHDRCSVRARPAPGGSELLACQPRADADDLCARGGAVLYGRARHHAGDRALLLAYQRRVCRRPAGSRRRLPGPDSVAQSSRRARRRADRGRSRRDRGGPVRTARPAPAVRRSRRRGHDGAARRSTVRPRRVRYRRYQRSSGRHDSVQQMEFVLENRRLRARARRLVAQLHLYRTAA